MKDFAYLERLYKTVDRISPPSRIMKISSIKNMLYPKSNSFINTTPDEAEISTHLYSLIHKNTQLSITDNDYLVNKNKTIINILLAIATFLDDCKASQKGSRLKSRVYFSTLLVKKSHANESSHECVERVLSSNKELANLLIAIYETIQKTKIDEKVLLQLCKDLNKKYGDQK